MRAGDLHPAPLSRYQGPAPIKQAHTGRIITPEGGSSAPPHPAAAQRLALYANRERSYLNQITTLGLPLTPRIPAGDRQALLDRLEKRGARVRNAGASVSTGALSSACVACTGDTLSRTYMLSLHCHRNCYFCFNPNQQGFGQLANSVQDCKALLAADAAACGDSMTHVALTGGEPLLHAQETVDFFAFARERFPAAHLRLYTSGDLLDKQLLAALAKAGLDEIRFSLKLDDDAALAAQVRDKLILATRFLPQVMVEMPVIPGTGAFMRELLRFLDTHKAFGINLLEFGFPFHNVAEFVRRGFALATPPWEVLTNYHYAGGLPIAQSDELALELVAWAQDEGLTLGVHYCSLTNKHRDQILTQNRPYAGTHPHYTLDPEDFFLKSAVVYGHDVPRVAALLAPDKVPTSFDASENALQFPPAYASQTAQEGAQVYLSYALAQPTEEGVALQEVHFVPLASAV